MDVVDHGIGFPSASNAVVGDDPVRNALPPMTNDDPNKQVAHEDRRSESRHPGTDQAKIRFGDQEVMGRVENLSEGGLFIVLDGPLTLDVELGAERGVEPRCARLVRCQALPGGKSGWGLQFDIDGPND